MLKVINQNFKFFLNKITNSYLDLIKDKNGRYFKLIRYNFILIKYYFSKDHLENFKLAKVTKGGWGYLGAAPR